MSFADHAICASALPESVPEQGIDLGQIYFAERRSFFSLAAVATLLVTRRRCVHWLVACTAIALVTFRLFTQHLG